MDIGSKIRYIRKQQNRTLEEISSYCGFSKSLLSKIENGITIPPIARLVTIADALGVTVSYFLEEDTEEGTGYTQKEEYQNRNRWIKTEKGDSFYAFFAERSNKLMQPYYFVAKKGEIKKHVLSHKGEEFIFVLEGNMKYKVGRKEYTLKAGDALYFTSLEEHTLSPLSDEVRYLVIICDT